MTAEQAYLVRKTFAQLEQHGEVGALVFYRRLFELDPGLRPLFKSDIRKQARKLMDMLGALIALLERPLELEAELRALGARHAGYGVRDAHYATVGAALLDMLAEALQEKFTPATAEAWRALYAAVEAIMQEGARAGKLMVES